MFANIFRKLSEKRLISLRYFDKNILTVEKNARKEWICQRNLINISSKLETTDNCSLDIAKSSLRHITNLAIKNETSSVKYNLLPLNTEITDNDIENLTNLNWTSLSTQEFVSNFEKLSAYIYKLQENPDIDFDNILQALSNSISNFSVEELTYILNYSILWNKRVSELEVIKEKMLTILDQELIKRLPELDTETIVTFCYLFNKANYAKKARYVAKALFKNAKKFTHFPPSLIVKYMNIIGICRNLPIHFYTIELSLEDKWEQFNKDELLLTLSSLSRNKYTIKNPKARKLIFELILKYAEDFTSANITTIIKYTCLAYKKRDEVDDILYKILMSFEPKLDQLSEKALAHILTFSTHIKVYEKKLIDHILDRIESIGMENINLPDIDRISNAMAVFNYDSSNHLYQKIVEQLNSPERQEEIDHHPKAFTRTVRNLTIVNIYPINLIEKIMDPGNLKKYYKTCAQRMDESIFCIDRSVVAELPNYTGPLLPKKIRKFFATTFKSDAVSLEKHTSNTTKEIIDTCAKILQSTCITWDKILPQYFERDIIFCWDKDNNLISPEPFLSKFESDDVKTLSEEAKTYKWLVLALSSGNMILKNNELNGIIRMRCRLLKSLGYTPLPISHLKWHSFKKYDDFEKRREDYLRSLLNIN